MLSEIRPPKVGQWTEPALRVLRERYLLRDERGEVIETPEEMCWRVAQSIAVGEARYGRSPAAVREVAEAFYDMMVDGYFIPNSPTLITVDVAYRINTHSDYAVANALCLLSLLVAAGGAAFYLRHAVKGAETKS